MLICLVFPLLGASIQAIGEGATISEAKVYAAQELLTNIIVTVSSEQRLLQSASANEKSELFLEDIHLQSELDLIGVEYQIEEQKKDQVVVRAVLSDSTLPLYMDKLSLLNQSIDEIEKSLEKHSSIESKKVILLRLIRYYTEYEAYSIIVRLFDNAVQIPKLSRTRAGAELDYLNLLMAESEILNITLADIRQDTLSARSQLSAAEAKSQIQMIAQQLDINQKELKRIEQEQAKKRELYLSDIQKSIQESAKRMALLAESKNGRALLKPSSGTSYDLIVQQEELKQRYLEIQQAITEEYTYISEDIKNRYEQEIALIDGASFRIGEITNGMPTEWAVKFRNDQIAKKNSEMQAELDSILKALENAAASQMDDLKSSIEVGYKNLESITFSLDSSSGDLIYTILPYDGLKRAWPVIIKYSVLGVDFQHTVDLTYSKVTSSTLPDFSLDTEKSIEAYHQYLNNVELYETYLLSTTSPLTIRINYSISIADQSSSYVIIPRSYLIIRSDTEQIIIEQSIQDAVLVSKIYAYKPVSDIQFLYKSIYSLEVSQFEEKQRELEIKEKERDRKQAIKNRMASELKDSWKFYRSGIGVSAGIGFLTYSYTYTSMYSQYELEGYVTDFPLSLYAFFTPVNYIYLGASLDGHLITDIGDDKYPMYVACNTILGLTYPLYSKLGSNVWKPFIELRLGVSTIGAESAFGFGIDFYDENIGFDVDYSIRINTSGPIKGMFSFIMGFTF